MPDWVVSAVTDFTELLNNKRQFNQDIIITMEHRPRAPTQTERMFYFASKFNHNLSNWDVGK